MSAEDVVGIGIAKKYHVVAIDETSAAVITENGRVEGGIGRMAVHCRRHGGRRHIFLGEDDSDEQRREAEDGFEGGREGGHGGGDENNAMKRNGYGIRSTGRSKERAPGRAKDVGSSSRESRVKEGGQCVVECKGGRAGSIYRPDQADGDRPRSSQGMLDPSRRTVSMR